MSDTHRKQAFQHAVRTLAHPFSLLSMAVLFFNDYYLRIVHPSWLTGKLGDFAWLFFFPVFLTALLVWVLPRKWLKGNIPILIGIGITAVVFILGKTVPVVLQAMISTLEWALPWNFTGVADFTDLIALPVMGLTLMLWKNLLLQKPTLNLKWKYLLIGAAGLLTMGNMGMPISGVHCIQVSENALIATVDRMDQYISEDGGIQWKIYKEENTDNIYSEPLILEICDDASKTEFIAVDPNNPQNQFRFIADQSIDRSTDGGETWEIDYQLKPKSEAEEAFYDDIFYYFKDKVGMLPVNAVFDPGTGNLVMAMAFDGALVREPDGNYFWSEVGNYHHEELTFKGLFYLLYPPEVFLAVFLASVCVGTFLYPTMKTFHRVLLIITGLGTLLYGIVLQPARYFSGAGYGSAFYLVAWGGLGVLSIVLLKMVFSRMRPVLPMIVAFAVIPVVHLGIMILWGYNIIPWYLFAFSISLVLIIGWTVYWHIQCAKLRRSIEDNLTQAQET